MTIWYAIGLALLASAILGAWRGWLREVGTLAGLLVTWSAVLIVGRAVLDQLNRLFLMLAFTFEGGFDDRAPGVLLESLRRHPLIDPGHPDAVLGALCVLFVALSVAVPFRFIPPVRTFRGRILGAFVGLANGYLIVYLALRFLAPALGLRSTDLRGIMSVTVLLEHNLSTLLIVGIVLIVGVGLLSSTRAPGKGSSRAFTARPRSRAGAA